MEVGCQIEVTEFHTGMHNIRNCSIRVFICGDYQFLSKLYGLSGPCGTFVTKYACISIICIIIGRHPCLWCLISLSEMQISKSVRGLSEVHSLLSFHNYHKSFMESYGDAKLVKEFYNCITIPFFDLPPSQTGMCMNHMLIVEHHFT